MKYDIMSVPAVILEDDEGNIIDKVIGQDLDKLQALIDKA
jgi:hypothetical protein